MDGYWGRPDETAATIKDGWLHTGDVGVFDEQNRLKITDRKKDLIVNAGGDNISPQRVEGVLALEAEIEHAMVYGDRRPNLVALIVPDPDFAKTWATDHNLKAEDLAEDQGFRAVISTAVDKANEKLSSFERVRRFAISPETFTMDNGFLTPTLKIRRKFIVEAYKDRLDALYGGK
jgi:long-chain acyl-CoA synthetase